MVKQLATRVGSHYRQLCVVAVGLAAPVLALAAPPDPFDAAISDITTKIGEYGAALVGVAAVGVVFMVGMKYVKKIRGAA